MTIQDIAPVADKYTIKGWQEGHGDPHVDLEVRTGDYDGSLLPLADVAELIRSAVEAVAQIETVEVRHQSFSASDTVVPAP